MTIQARQFSELSVWRLYEILRLRSDVFVVEQQCPYPELDGRDTAEDTYHLWAERDGVVLTYLRLLHDSDDPRWQIGRVCTAMQARGAGLASRLLAEALRLTGSDPVWMHAQCDATGLYRRAGFVAVGEPFDDDGIAHILMRRDPGT